MSTAITKIQDLKLRMAQSAILGTISKKTDIRNFRSGNGKLFEIEIFDDQSIKMVFFGANVDKHFNKIEQGKTYRIESFNITPANAQFDQGYTYKLQCNDNTVFLEDDSKLFEKTIVFTPFKDILDSDVNKYYGKKQSYLMNFIKIS